MSKLKFAFKMRRGLCETVFVIFLLLVFHSDGNDGRKDKVEYIRLPLLTFDEKLAPVEAASTLQNPIKFISDSNLTDHGEGRKYIFENDSNPKLKGPKQGETDQELNSMTSVINQLTDFVIDEGDDESDENDEEELGTNQEEKVAEDDDDDNDFNELDLMDLVQALERQADAEEQSGILPEILDILHGKVHDKKGNSNSHLPTSTIASSSVVNNEPPSSANGTVRMYLNEDGDLQLGSGDLSEYSEEIVDGISAGVEESLRMSDDPEIDDFNITNGADNGTVEMRQFSIYLFQGQYYAEPRLNRFIDGALRNMGTELRVASMDPLYFRVLPRGQVAEREQPLMAASGGGSSSSNSNSVRRRRPSGGVVVVGRQLKLPAFFRPNANKNNQNRQQQLLRQQLLKQPVRRQKVVNGQQQVTRLTSLGGRNIFLRRQKQQRQRRRRQRLKQQRLKNQRRRKQQQQLQKQKRKKQQQQLIKNQQQLLLQRIRRRTRQDVGGGRIEGLSRVERDGDAEMQLFGNYTLIRSHMKYGPVEITMQFRTKNGIRRSGATLPVIRAHTVTRVNHEGSEMIDFLLDRPTPEMIRVRGTLFPLAQRIARNIFARLFLPNSFLTSKLREKAHLAYLSKPAVSRRKR